MDGWNDEQLVEIDGWMDRRVGDSFSSHPAVVRQKVFYELDSLSVRHSPSQSSNILYHF